ncbi:MAG: hypothetical protein Q613_PSC00308G0001, partial [Propionibacterium sp. DORA_15]
MHVSDLDPPLPQSELHVSTTDVLTRRRNTHDLLAILGPRGTPDENCTLEVGGLSSRRNQGGRRGI